MALYDVWICGTADWFSAKIEGENTFLISGKASVSLDVKEGPGVSQVSLTDHKVQINRPYGSTGRVLVHAYVKVPDIATSIMVELCHGNNGCVRISSRFDSFSNDEIVDSAHNCRKGELLLTSAAKTRFESDYEMTAKKGDVTDLKGQAPSGVCDCAH